MVGAAEVPRCHSTLAERSARIVGRCADPLSTLGLTTPGPGGSRVGWVKRLAIHPLRPFDLVVPAGVAVVGVADIAGSGEAPVAVGIVTYVLASAVLVLRRVVPLWLAPGGVALFVFGILLGFDATRPAAWNLLVVLACFFTGLCAPHAQRWLGLLSVLAAAAVAMAAMEWLTTFDPNLVFGAVATVIPWAFGVMLRSRLDAAATLAVAAERARVDALMAADRAVEAERERIAAELHDVLAHTLGEMVVQASVAGDRVRAAPHEASAALERVALAGRQAVAETGRLLRLLRDHEDELGLSAAARYEPAGSAPAPTRSRRPAAVGRGLILPAVIGIAGTAEVAAPSYTHVGAWLAGVWLTAAVLCARSRFPLLVCLVAPSILILTQSMTGADDGPAIWMAATAVACFGAGGVPRARAVAGLAAVVGAAALVGVCAQLGGDLNGDAFTMGPVIFLGSWGAGFAVRETFDRSRRLAADAERHRLQMLRDGERAAAAERKRIARDLHDVLATSFSVMIVQASVAAAVTATDPDSALAAVAEVERAGRAALAEVGRLLRLIRAGESTGTEPQHGIDDLPALAEQYARAGLDVTLAVDGVGEHVPAGIGLSTYRIVQEALTNVLKHAPGSSVAVRVSRAGESIAIEVRNAPGAAGTSAAAPSGHGLAGLRERVSVFGGGLDARPTADGGFLVAASLPHGAEPA